MSKGCMACGHGLTPKQYWGFLQQPFKTTPREWCRCANGQKLAKERALTRLVMGKPQRIKQNHPTQSMALNGQYNSPIPATRMKKYFGGLNGKNSP